MNGSRSLEAEWRTLAIGSLVTFGLYILYDIWSDRREKSNLKSRRREEEEQEKKKRPKFEVPLGKTLYGEQSEPVLKLSSQQRAEESKEHTDSIIYKICLTGGPCAGKTTALARLSESITQRGFRVYVVPEVATLLFNAGAMKNRRNYNEVQAIRFQRNLMLFQMDLEDYFTEIAALGGGKAVVFCDRGVMDGSAYLDPISWQTLVDELGVSTLALRDRRYDAVIHLVTAADGATEFYTLENNAARRESSLDNAIEVDIKLRKAWMGHPRYYLIDNTSEKGFESKIRRAFEAVLDVIGAPQAVSFYKKYLLTPQNPIEFSPDLQKNLKVEVFDVEDTFLMTDSDQRRLRIRKRGQNGQFAYILQEETYTKNGEKIVVTRRIASREYLGLSKERDQSRKTLVIKRRCFLWEGQYYIVDTYLNVLDGFSLLIIEADRQVREIKLPPFINIAREVTDEPDYSSYILSKTSYYPKFEDKPAVTRNLPN